MNITQFLTKKKKNINIKQDFNFYINTLKLNKKNSRIIFVFK